ncbi:MAG: hypothetical protein K9J85_03185 [Desulfobacteraceae bacterium]|nr:hypothetical protein [Desulfobacteraceae bacterium]
MGKLLCRRRLPCGQGGAVFEGALHEGRLSRCRRAEPKRPALFERTTVHEFAGRGEARRADARPECSERKDCPAASRILTTSLRLSQVFKHQFKIR